MTTTEGYMCQEYSNLQSTKIKKIISINKTKHKEQEKQHKEQNNLFPLPDTPNVKK